MINAITFYRAARWLYEHHVPFLPKLIKLLIFLVYNSAIPFECSIGKRSKFGYGAIGVVIHKSAIIGNNVLIGPNVTIGGRSNKRGAPVIGNDVYIGTGAKVLGNIKIGDRVLIGANAVVISDIPNDCVAAGVPARVIKEGVDIFALCNLEQD